MANISKADLLADVAERAGVSVTDSDSVLGAFFDVLTRQAKRGNKITWPGFGAFSTSERKARSGRNPATGETMQIPASTVMKFSAAKALKEKLN